MITPSDVKMARILLARKASMATDRVSRTAIMAPLASHQVSWTALRVDSQLPTSSICAAPSILLQPFQRFTGVLAFRIELQRSLVFADGRLRLALILIQPAQPLVRFPGARVAAAVRSVLQILAQQGFRIAAATFRKDQSYRAIEISARVCGSCLLAFVRDAD